MFQGSQIQRTGGLVGKPERKRQLGRFGVDGRNILKCILQK